MKPKTVTTDFEAPLFKAVGEQFSNARRIGCKFHFKQALRRKLINLDFAADDVQRLMRPGCLDRIRETEKVSIGETLNALRHENEIEDDEKWKSFCDYFSHTWIRGCIPFDTWNVSEQQGNDDELFATNNAMECFNRQLNSSFSSAHPNIFRFIEVIRQISATKLEEIKDIKERGGGRPNRGK